MSRKKGNIKKYQVSKSFGSKYVFPFNVLDDTPGGKNLGRINWNFEFYPAKKRRGENTRRIGKLLVWASQTRDERYKDVEFEFETYAEMFMTDTINKNFIVSRVAFCEEHKGAVVISAHPENHHKELVVKPDSSVFFELKFN